jgi:hypothetical protein
MRLGTPEVTLAQRLFWAWALQFGVAIFAAWWLHTRGLWRQLIEGDPSGISVAIALVREEPANTTFLTGGTLTMELVAWR